MSRKGQILSYDFLIATTLFILVLTVVLFYWTYASKQIDDTVVKNDMSNKLFLATQIWFDDGFPKYWNASDVLQIGLTNDGYLNNTKVDSLDTIGYQKVLDMIGVRGYNVYYRVFDESNSTKFEFGIYPINASNIAKFNRLSVLNGSFVTIETLVWA